MKLCLDEVRRLTGANLLSDQPGAIADVFIEGLSPTEVVNTWLENLTTCLAHVKWQENYYTRFYAGGASVSISAPMDLLYSACDVLETAWDWTVATYYEQPFDQAARLAQLSTSVLDEANPALIALLQKAKAENVVCLADDDEVSLGTGPSAQTWPIGAFPSPDNIDFSRYQNIPTALITGTNGKTTSVRLAAEIANAEGIEAGVTSTDFIKVGKAIIDEGDYSGPGGARMLLRDNRTELALLEVARGGLLRRGLPIEQAQAALVTNVASDHLGQYGINTVDDIAHVKLMVAKAIKHSNTLVLNADDERLVKYSAHIKPPKCWFSVNSEHPLIQQHIQNSLPCAYLKDGKLIYSHKQAIELAAVADVPITVAGTALHNIQNALGVIGLCMALGISPTAITNGLKRFGRNTSDNPGRTNIYSKNGVTFVVDFAHNAHSMQAVLNMAKQMPQTRSHIMFSHAGDRSNQDIYNVCNSIVEFAPNTFVLAELSEYLRGREANEISDMVATYLQNKGVKNEHIMRAEDAVKGTQILLKHAQAGDLVLLFVLAKREQVQSLLSH